MAVLPVLAAALAVGLLKRSDEGPSGLLVLAEEPTVVRLQGELRLWRSAVGQSELVAGVATVAPDDRIHTGANGRATLTWPGGAVATLDPESAAALVPSPSDGPPRLELSRGRVWMDGGPEPGAPPVELVTADGVWVVGRRFRARRDDAGRVVVSSADAPVEVRAREGLRELPAGATSEVLPGQLPGLARPALVPRALALTVDGPPFWLLVDRFGRVVGVPPGGGPWLDYLPGVRGPLPHPHGAAVVLPNPRGEYHLLLWARSVNRPFRIAIWATDGQALFGGPPPTEPADALRVEGVLGAIRPVVIAFTTQEKGITLSQSPREVAELPAILRLAMAPTAPVARLAAGTPVGAHGVGAAAFSEPAANPTDPAAGAMLPEPAAASAPIQDTAVPAAATPSPLPLPEGEPPGGVPPPSALEADGAASPVAAAPIAAGEAQDPSPTAATATPGETRGSLTYRIEGLLRPSAASPTSTPTPLPPVQAVVLITPTPVTPTPLSSPPASPVRPRQGVTPPTTVLPVAIASPTVLLNLPTIVLPGTPPATLMTRPHPTAIRTVSVVGAGAGTPAAGTPAPRNPNEVRSGTPVAPTGNGAGSTSAGPPIIGTPRRR